MMLLVKEVADCYQRPRVIRKAVVAEASDNHDVDGDVEIPSCPSSQAGTNHQASGDERGPVPSSADDAEDLDDRVANGDRNRALKIQTGRKRSRSHVDPASSDEDVEVPVRKAKKTQKVCSVRILFST